MILVAEGAGRARTGGAAGRSGLPGRGVGRSQFLEERAWWVGIQESKARGLGGRVGGWGEGVGAQEWGGGGGV